jgi:uncharacterized membrane protein (UPF0182 family)
MILMLIACAGPYTEFLWFKEDARHPEVFAKIYETKGYLFIGAFAASLILVYISLSRALKVSMVFLDKPATVQEMVVSRVLGFVQLHGDMVTKIASVIIAFFIGLSFSGEWNSFLLWQHGKAFHHADPLFGLDLGFYVFSLPWQISLINALLGCFFLITVLTGGIYFGLQSIAALARIELGRPAVKGHLAILIGSTVLLFGVKLWLARYLYVVTDSGQFTGAGYTAVHQLPVQSVLAIALIAVGALGVISAFWQWAIKGVVYGLSACALLWVGGMLIYPWALQVFSVTPNKLSKESPYAANAITMTRFAYGLDAISEKSTAVQATPSAADLTSAQSTLDNMRLWDPTIIRQSIEALQGLKNYYIFHDVDIDRYKIDGQQKMVMVSARDISTAGITQSAQNWVTTRLQYTHGFGLTVSPVNTSTGSGRPEFLVHDIPPVAPKDLAITQPRIYFSDYRNSSGETDNNYVLVDTNVAEFDYPAEGNDQTFRWTGDRGISMGSFFPKLAYAFALGDFNLLISPNITSKSRLLVHRDILDRAQEIYPFLHFDNDPYTVIYQGRLLWILDGFTGSNDVPYSDRMKVGDWSVNYLRNPVKLVIDAYTGETSAYAIDSNEPILQAYRDIYPGLIQDKSAIPTGLEAHFRYPEDLFDAQAMQLTQYHVTEPVAFLNNEDAWDMPTERGVTGAEEAMQPYYVQMRLPEDATDQFMLILPFTPRQKGNMSGWLAAHCDPQSYGQLRLYEYPRGTILLGPKQMEAKFNQNPAIANLNTLLKNAQSEVIVGNLLVMPIGNSVLYAEPMFLESSSPGIPALPELKKVVLAVGDQVVVGDTYADALKQLFGTTAGVTATPTIAPPGPAAPLVNGKSTPVSTQPTNIGVVSKADIAQALKLANDADAALRSGDFAKYGELQKQLKTKLQQLSGSR